MMPSQRAVAARHRLAAGHHSLASPREEVLHLIGWATLAPSTHNTQPWRFDVDGTNVCIRPDKNRRVPEADPDTRDLHMSLGALLRHIELVGERVGCVQDLAISRDMKSGCVATFTFAGSGDWREFSSSDLGNAILWRQNYRGAYADKEVGASSVSAIAEQASTALVIGGGDERYRTTYCVIDGSDERAHALYQLTADGIAEAYGSSAFRREVAGLVNSNYSNSYIGLHGYSLTMGNLASVAVPHIMRYMDIGAKLGALNMRSLRTSQGVVVLTSESDDARSWINAGRALAELSLRLHADGIKTSIYAAAIEIGELRDRVAHTIGLTNGHPLLLVTYGYEKAPIGMSHRQPSTNVTRFA